MGGNNSATSVLPYFKTILNSPLRKGFMPAVEGRQFTAPSRNSSASYRADHNAVCPTKVGRCIKSLLGGEIREGGKRRAQPDHKVVRIDYITRRAEERYGSTVRLMFGLLTDTLAESSTDNV